MLIVAVLAVTGFALSLSHPSSLAFLGEAQNGDAAYWDLNAESWARGYAAAKVPDIRTGYSVFLGIVYVLTGPDFWHAFVAQALLYATGVGILYFLGKRIAGRLVGALAAAQFAVNPYMWEWTAITTTELLGSIANLAALAFLARAFRGQRLWSAALFGVCIAAANIVRSLTLPFLPLGLLLLALAPGRRRQRLVRPAVALVAALVTLLPAAVYQQIATGDAGLSSNGAANLYGASSPKYQAWSPEMTEDVSRELQARGILPTPQAMDAEYMRLTLQNYVQYPGYQLSRLVSGEATYLNFEGQLARPEAYAFIRPAVVLALLLAGIGVFLLGGGRLRFWWPVLVLGLAVGLLRFGSQSMTVLQTAGLLAALVGVVLRRSASTLTLFAVAAYWVSTSALAIWSSGASGALLFRLYTQLEPQRCLLIAVGAGQIVALAARTRLDRARLLQLAPAVQQLPRLPGAVRGGLALGAALTLGTLVAGTAALAMVNLRPPADGPVFAAPTREQVAQLGPRLGIQAPLRYVEASSFADVSATLMSGSPSPDEAAYIMPGQFSRFLWYLADEDRTLFWFVFSDTPRPAALDRTQLLGEAHGRLKLDTYRDRDGLFVMVPTSPYFQNTGDWRQIVALSVRAFVPWNPAAQRFEYESPIVFPLDVTLYDPRRLAAAEVVGQVTPVGSITLMPDSRLVPTLSFQGPASITFQDIWVPPGARARFWVAARTGRDPRLELRVGPGLGEVVSTRALQPRGDAAAFEPFEADLSAYAGQHVALTLRVLGSDGTPPAEVLVGDPRLVMPPVSPA